MVLAILIVCAALVLLSAAAEKAPQEVPVKRSKD
jgi:hypothetical protein